MSVVSIRDLTFAWPGADRPTLHDMDWRLDTGTFALLIGRSGSGKSTLLRSLNGLVPHFSGGMFAGDVIVAGNNTRSRAPRDLAGSVGFVFQDPESQLLTNRVVDDIAFSLEQLGVPRNTMKKRVEEMLDLVGVAHLRDRSPSTLSGGERQRVAIASALALHPQVLALDEPTSQLDPWGAEEVIAALTRMNDDLGLTIVLAEHRLERVLSQADTVRLLDDDGHPTDGTPERIVHDVAAVALPPVSQIARACGWRDIPLTVKSARQLRLMRELGERLQGVKPSSPKHTPGDVALRLSDLCIEIEGKPIVRDVSLDVRQGELLALMGRNGSGKTTLLRGIIGFQHQQSGEVRIGNMVRNGSSPRGVGYVPQRPGSLFFNETLGEELEFTARKRGVTIDVNERLAEVDLAWAKDRHPSTLSVGERQRAAIATVLAGDPQLLLLDEPTRGMDPWHKRQLGEVIRRLQDRGVAIVMATHDVELAAELATNVAMLGDGGVVAYGAPEAVLADSLTYSTQVNKVFGHGWLTVDQVLAAIR